jgi:hypothetical protein
VVSANVHRRHLNESQRSMIAAELTRLGEENEVAPVSWSDRGLG